MTRLDDLITDLTSSQISRRQFMARAAALGLSAPALQLLSTANVVALEGNQVRWVSPRQRLEVFDDYPYWVAKKYGYFGDIETTMEAGTGSGDLPLVVENQSDMGYPSPGVFNTSLEQELPIVSVFNMGAYDVFDFAFRKGEATDDLKTLEGKTIVVGHDSWIEICKPMFAAAGADIETIEYAVATPTSWGPVFNQGEGDAALSWEGLRAQWNAEGLEFDYWLGMQNSDFPANSFVIRSSDFDDASTHEIYTNYLRGWAMGLEFGHHNPRAAAQIVNEVPELQEGLDLSFPDDKKAIAVASMWERIRAVRSRAFRLGNCGINLVQLKGCGVRLNLLDIELVRTGNEIVLDHFLQGEVLGQLAGAPCCVEEQGPRIWIVPTPTFPSWPITPENVR